MKMLRTYLILAILISPAFALAFVNYIVM